MDINMEKLKSLANEIIQEESQRINKKINFYPITTKEYYKKYLSEQKNNRNKILNILTKSSNTSGFNDTKGNIVIFIDKVNKITPNERKLFAIVLYCYHEARHTEQKLLNRYIYESFLTDVEIYLIGEHKLNYKNNHNKFSFEIDANNYSIKKTKEYLIKKYPEVYNKVKDEIKTLEKNYYKDYFEYDTVNLVEKIIDFMKYKLKINLAEEVHSMEIISPVLEIFLFSDLTFKSIRMIQNDERFKTLDKRIIYAFLSSKQFLESLNIDNLTEEELLLFYESLKYTNDTYLIQNISSKKEYKRLQENLKFQRNILKTISSKRKINKEEKKRIKRLENISSSLEQTRNKLIKK